MSNVIPEILERHGLARFGFARLERPLSFDLYKDWVESGMNASMDYLKEHLELKEAPQKLLPRATSAIVVALDYAPTHPAPLVKEPFPHLKKALYSKGKDYHWWLKKKLNQVVQDLSLEFKGEEFMAFTDSGPILERDLAARAGLGWIGKNSCLIDSKRGSLFFIGEILTSLELSVTAELAPDRCGTCTRCLDVCPTQALVAPRKLDANRCISFWNIESKEIPPLDLRDKFQGWHFGCDLCQTVCPWNQKVFGPQIHLTKSIASKDLLIEDLRFILTRSNTQIDKVTKDTPLSRAHGPQHKRNALLSVSHHVLHELTPEVQALKADPKLGELAGWVLTNLAQKDPAAGAPTFEN